MAECVSYRKIESLTLQQICDLTTAISADLTRVASKLLEKEVITLTQLHEAQLHAEYN